MANAIGQLKELPFLFHLLIKHFLTYIHPNPYFLFKTYKRGINVLDIWIIGRATYNYLLGN